MFASYMAPLAKVLSAFEVDHHSFADDIFVYAGTTCHPTVNILQVTHGLEQAVAAVSDWYTKMACF